MNAIYLKIKFYYIKEMIYEIEKKYQIKYIEQNDNIKVIVKEKKNFICFI